MEQAKYDTDLFGNKVVESSEVNSTDSFSLLGDLEVRDKQRIWESAISLSAQYQAIEDANEEIKEVAANIKETYGLSPSTFKKIAKMYYQESLEEEKMKVREVFGMYSELSDASKETK